MARRNWPIEARRLYRVLYENDEDAQAILRGLPLKRGISEALFAELVVGGLYQHITRAERFIERDHVFHSDPRMNPENAQRIRRSAKEWPWTAPHAHRALKEMESWRAAHEETNEIEKEIAELLEPTVFLHALFTYLVEHSTGQGVEFYVAT